MCIVVHTFAVAESARLGMELLTMISTCLLALLPPSVLRRRYLMEDLHQIGGTPAVLKYLLAQNYIDGSCKTCTTHTLEKNLEQCPELKQGQDVILPGGKPIKETGHIQIIYGNLAPEGSVAKITGKEGERFSGPAVCFNSARHFVSLILSPSGLTADSLAASKRMHVPALKPAAAKRMRNMLRCRHA